MSQWFPYDQRPKYEAELKERAKANPDPFLRNIACCEKARSEFCVCMIHWICPEHGSVCIGTHD